MERKITDITSGPKTYRKALKIGFTLALIYGLVFAGGMQIFSLPSGVQEVCAATSTYTFSGVTNANAGTNGYPIAIEHDSDVFPWTIVGDQNDSGAPSDAEYVNISSDNTSEWVTDNPGFNDKMAITYRFFIQESIADITKNR